MDEKSLMLLAGFLGGVIVGLCILVAVLLYVRKELINIVRVKEQDLDSYNLEYPADFVAVSKKNAPTPPTSPTTSKH